jgi:hypothetical protein
MTATATRPRTLRCTRTPLRPTPTSVDLLRQDIADICQQIDRRLDNKPGTAERGTYFWYWPPEEIHSTEVLAALHSDAVEFLAGITGTQGALVVAKGDPLQRNFAVNGGAR